MVKKKQEDQTKKGKKTHILSFDKDHVNTIIQKVFNFFIKKKSILDCVLERGLLKESFYQAS